MAKKHVFISYDYDNDKHFKNLLLAWDKHKQFDFYISDISADIGIDSTNASRIKGVLTTKIKSGGYFLVIVGKSTYRSKWVRWEIEKAVALGRKIIAIKTDKGNKTPPELLGIDASWAYSFTHAAISNAIENA